ncbi:MAG TPA: D-alanyl-D-alanine carboxypeptidase [Blastocatellia bacterium]|nr:D-alanyl-D-alanine carboxypeptidase [Blastocatellia bacterium]
MTSNRLRKQIAVSLLIIFCLTCSVTFAEPAGRASKSRKAKTSARSSKKASKKSSARVARGKGSKSRKQVARTSRRGRGSARGGRLARGRGRNHRSKWRRQVARSAPSYHRTPIQNFLTQTWVSPQGQPGQNTGEPRQDSTTLTPVYTPAPAADATNSQRADQSLADPIPVNPLVMAFANSLAARGFEAENQGFIVTTMGGEVLAEHNADRPFNPASVIKVATSLAAISKLGPDFRFRTTLYTDGALDPSTGTLHGSLYVIGSGDPAFFYENALLIADKLNRSGIRAVEGDLVVLGQFYFNLSASREAAAKSFRNVLTPETWNAGVKSAFPRFLNMRANESRSGDNQSQTPWSTLPPSLKVSGQTITNSAVDTTNLKLLAVHTSLPLVRVLKGLNDFSNNWMANVIGNLVGGPLAVQAFLRTEVGLKDEELNIVTSSGLGSNYISPRGTIHILRKLIHYLDTKGFGIEEMLPVAGVDAGTLQRRYTDHFRGSVVGKTGTLSGVSALAGVAYTRGRGPLLFVIYNRGGSTYTFRAVQDETIKKVITFFGGPAPVRYSPTGGPRISERQSDAAGQTAVGQSPK